MTYEKGGSGNAGIAVRTEAKDTLTLKERIDHKYLTGIATIEATYQNTERVIKELIIFLTYHIQIKKINTKHI